MASLIRIILLLGAVGGIGYVVYQQPQIISQISGQQKVIDAVNYAEEQVKGATSSLNINTDSIVETILKELINKKIIQAPSSTEATTSTTIQLQQITNQISNELKDIPKNQAKEIIQSTCQQIIDNLDKQ